MQTLHNPASRNVQFRVGVAALCTYTDSPPPTLVDGSKLLVDPLYEHVSRLDKISLSEGWCIHDEYGRFYFVVDTGGK